MGLDRLSRLRATAATHLRRRLGLTRLEARLGSLEGTFGADINRAWELLDGHEERLARLELQTRVATVMGWIEHATLAGDPLVSVIVPTRDRATVLPRAIESVLSQSYRNLELLVCDDGSRDDTARVVDDVEDPRVRRLTAPGAGAGAARNRGLDAARGELIAYLDDDNRMHPNWLKSVVWAFEQRPEAEVLYGAIVIDDTARHHGVEGAEMPSLWLEPFVRERITEANVADSSAIAHRAGLAEARWDEPLVTMADWDFIIGVTATRDPLTLPAVACFYYSDAAARLTNRSRHGRRDRHRIRTRAARRAN